MSAVARGRWRGVGRGAWQGGGRDVTPACPTCGRSQLPPASRPMAPPDLTSCPRPCTSYYGQPGLGGVAFIPKSFILCVTVTTLGHVASLAANGPSQGSVSHGQGAQERGLSYAQKGARREIWTVIPSSSPER